MKLSIIVPAYNEEKTIGRVLDTLIDLDTGSWKKEIIVVDDGSNQATKGVLQRFSKKVQIYHHHQNLGKGAAIQSGLGKVTGDYVIIQDADLEYSPCDIRSLLIVSENNPGFAIFGSRFRGRHQDAIFGHKAGNLFLTFLTNLLFGSSLSDMETCYKLIPTKYFRRIELVSHRFNFEPEITAKLLKLGVGILEVPINYKKRDFSEGKKIRWLQDGISAVWTLFINRLT